LHPVGGFEGRPV